MARRPTNNRRYFLWAVLFLLLALPVLLSPLGAVGPEEVGVWLLLSVAWGVAFFTWGRPRTRLPLKS